MSVYFILASGSLRGKRRMNGFRTNFSGFGKVVAPEARSTTLVIPLSHGHDSLA
ncbi:MAG: hypothetical protein R6V44_12775 [Paracoccaceae bacterium]